MLPRLLRIKVPTKKYFDFLSKPGALLRELRFETVHSFFKNLKQKPIDLFKLALVAIDTPLIDFYGFMKVRYFFVEKRASPT